MNNIEQNLKEKCCGCRSCKYTCPVQAITMEKDSEGFSIPSINETKCIQCRVCIKRCPSIVHQKKNKVIKTYAAQIKNNEILKESSSGGIFSVIAENIIGQGGIVIGCKFNQNFEAEQVVVNRVEELEAIRGSKYVQSDTKDMYIEVEKNLKIGKTVLYTGTPCQVAGLKAYLKQDYLNLMTMDFVCHGVPSPKMFKAYVKDIEKRIGTRILSYKFRDKGKKGWGAVASYEFIKKDKVIKKYESGKINSYYYGFINKMFNRNVCYNCLYNGCERVSDITIGDYWGGKKYHPQFNFSKGVSLVVISTEIGIKMFEKVRNSMIIEESHIEYMMKENDALQVAQLDKEIPEVRKSIYSILEQASYKQIKEQYLTPKNYKWLVLKDKIPQSIKNMIKR